MPEVFDRASFETGIAPHLAVLRASVETGETVVFAGEDARSFGGLLRRLAAFCDRDAIELLAAAREERDRCLGLPFKDHVHDLVDARSGSSFLGYVDPILAKLTVGQFPGCAAVWNPVGAEALLGLVCEMCETAWVRLPEAVLRSEVEMVEVRLEG